MGTHCLENKSRRNNAGTELYAKTFPREHACMDIARIQLKYTNSKSIMFGILLILPIKPKL
jgi:hypothetical protein